MRRFKTQAFLILLLMLLAGLLRFSHLGVKPFWGDEVYSAVRLSGHSFAEARQRLSAADPLPTAAWLAPMHPVAGLDPSATVRALAVEAPEHPPLYYLLAGQWGQWRGGEPAQLRELSALFGLLLIPAGAALAWELWHSPTTSLLCAAVLAVSPFHVLYAQEVREYSLWAGLIAATSWALLRALRRRQALDWATYGLLASALLYTHFFSLPLLITQVVLLPFGTSPSRPRPWQPLFFTTALVLVAFLPWLWMASRGTVMRSGGNLWTQTSLDPGLLMWNWGLNLSRLWLDLDPTGRLLPGNGPGVGGLRLLAVCAGILACGLALAHQLRMSTDERRRLPALLLIALLMGSVLPLIAADLLLGGSRSAIARYPVGGYLAVQLAMVGSLGALLHHRRRAMRLLAFGLLGFWLMLSLGSSLAGLAAPTWWSKQGSYDQHRVAALINRYPHPVVMGDGHWPRLLSLSQSLRSDVRLLMLPPLQETVQKKVLDPLVFERQGQSPVFLYRPSPERIRAIRALTGRETCELYRSPVLFPYLPHVDRHSRLWLVALAPQGGSCHEVMPSANSLDSLERSLPRKMIPRVQP